jgi:hypothetical protein
MQPMLSPCVEWTGPRNRKGYGVTKNKNSPIRSCRSRSSTTAHRAAWIERYGPVPAGIHVAHACDNPSCVNTDHLFLATPLENVKDTLEKGRRRYCILNPEKVRDIRASSLRTKTLAEIYKISPCIISAVRNRKRWQHVH